MSAGFAPVGEEYMHDLREMVTKAEPDTIAVIVLSGSPELGLALAVSSKESAEDTYILLAHALTAEVQT